MSYQEILSKIPYNYLSSFLQKVRSSETPFEFTEFPILVKGTDIFKLRGDKETRYIDLEPILRQFRNIRKAGNWPTHLFQHENIELHIASRLLQDLQIDEDIYLYGDTYFYMDPTLKGNPKKLATNAYEESVFKLKAMFDTICIYDEDEKIDF